MTFNSPGDLLAYLARIAETKVVTKLRRPRAATTTEAIPLDAIPAEAPDPLHSRGDSGTHN